MKIFIASSYKDSWNSVRPEAEIFIEMAQRGHQITIATQSDAPYCQRFRDNGIQVIDLYPKRKICISTILQYRDLFKENGFDIAYAMNSKTIPNVALAAVCIPIKFITYRGTAQGLYWHDPFAYLTHLNPRVDAICCQAKAVEKEVRKQVWRKKTMISTVYKGQDYRWYGQQQFSLAEIGIPKDAFVAICVANARPSKGVDILIKAAAPLLEKPDSYVLIIGRGVSKSSYTSLRNSMKDGGRIILIEHRIDAAQIIAAASIYVQPSISGEGLTKTVPEAMAQGVPAIVTTAGGMHELVEHETTGWIVPAGSVADLAQALVNAYNQRHRLKSMGQAALWRLKTTFSIERSVNELIKFFENVLNHPSSRKD